MQRHMPSKSLLSSRNTLAPFTRRNGRPWLAGIATILMAVSAAHAQQAPTNEVTLRPSYHACVQASQGVTLALNNCIAAEHTFQDKRLNSAYLQLRKSLPKAERVRLRDQERAWITHRDKVCAPESDGGTASLLDANQCQLNETAARAAALEARMDH